MSKLAGVGMAYQRSTMQAADHRDYGKTCEGSASAVQ
jgi:hypothetical protein